MDGIEIEQVDGEHALLPRLLAGLDALHHLRDSVFAAPTRTTGDGEPDTIRLLAHRDGHAEGFLEGNPGIGHIAIVGVLHPRCGVGSALVRAFIDQARTVGAGAVTVVLDTDPQGRWGRRRFFEALGFTAEPGSVLHFRLQ
ncbi:GNAT family N-acetyltransferase [Nocardia asteroides]|uniref:GNAT family N-acetyltransferase n=1 Tax=Nocardia asteroides TaxID=1824 RepID=UPI003417CE83